MGAHGPPKILTGPTNIWFRNDIFSLNIITRNDEKCSISVKQVVSTLHIVYWGLVAVITRVELGFITKYITGCWMCRLSVQFKYLFYLQHILTCYLTYLLLHLQIPFKNFSPAKSTPPATPSMHTSPMTSMILCWLAVTPSTISPPPVCLKLFLAAATDFFVSLFTWIHFFFTSSAVRSIPDTADTSLANSFQHLSRAAAVTFHSTTATQQCYTVWQFSSVICNIKCNAKTTKKHSVEMKSKEIQTKDMTIILLQPTEISVTKRLAMANKIWMLRFRFENCAIPA